MLVELHLLTPHAPANLNRDDFGRPKTALFGGTERGRISSQALKRAIRKSPFVEERLADRISTRSLHIPQMLYDEMKGGYEGEDRERLEKLCEAVTHALGKPDKDNALKTSQIVFLTPDEIARIRALVREKMDDGTRLTGKAVKEFGDTIAKATGLDQRPTDAVDMALFGRMTTDDADAFKAVDASMQVAHPIATHTTVTETDYFTAVDDWKAGGGSGGDTDTRGSGHIGELDFNSAVYYKYLSCDLDALVENMGGDRAAAFEAPVPASENGYAAESTRRMLRRYARLVDAYELDDEAVAFTLDGELPEGPYERAERLSELWAFLRRHANGDA